MPLCSLKKPQILKEIVLPEDIFRSRNTKIWMSRIHIVHILSHTFSFVIFRSVKAIARAVPAAPPISETAIETLSKKLLFLR